MDTPQSEEAFHDIPEDWDIIELWKKYEEIAMHFNDLLIRLRTQALASVAALSILTSIFAIKTDTSVSWAVGAIVFFILSLFWIAIWILDFTYYNKLLIGAVVALVELEENSKTKTRIDNIQISTIIESVVAGSCAPYSDRNSGEKLRLRFGRWAFYLIVFIALNAGTLLSYWKYNPTP